MTTNETTPHFSFPLPVKSNDLSVDVDNLRAAILAFDLQLYGVFNDLAAKAASGHSHAVADVQSLQATLDDLTNRTAPERLNDLDDVDAASSVTGHFLKYQSNVWVSSAISISNVNQLTEGLNQKLNKSFDNLDDATAAKTALGLNQKLNKNFDNLDDATAAKTALGMNQKLNKNFDNLDDATAAKTALDLNNLDNTPDAGKPVSTAQQTALDAKVNIADAGILSGFRNKFINGDFDIWQNGTRFTFDNGYTADQLRLSTGGGSGRSGSISRGNFNAGSDGIPGNPEFYLDWEETTAGTGYAYKELYQPIEGVRTLANGKATLTIWARCPVGGFDFQPLLRQYPNGSAAVTIAPNGGAQSIPTDGVFKRYNFVFDVPSLSGATITAGNNLRCLLPGPLTSAFQLHIAHISLVPGDATQEHDPCPPRHIQQELELCQRYFEKSYDLDVPPGTVTDIGRHVYRLSGSYAAGAFGTIGFKVMKRVPPTMVLYSTGTGASGRVYNISAGADRTGLISEVGLWGVTVGQSSSLGHSNDFSFMGVAFTADARL